ncbi:MAG: DUF5915 domain-containing protein, partial [Dehalococcoidia bacterium]
PELEAEGTAREVVHMVQNLRKTAGLQITDRVVLYVEAPASVVGALSAHDEYVKGETLATAVVLAAPPAGATSESRDLGGAAITLGVVRAG